MGGVSDRSETELRRQTAMQGSDRFYEESPKNKMKAGGCLIAKRQSSGHEQQGKTKHLAR